MAEPLTLGRVRELIQEVGDSVEVLLDAAIFPDRMMAEDGPDPRVARYMLALRGLAEAFGLNVARKYDG